MQAKKEFYSSRYLEREGYSGEYGRQRYPQNCQWSDAKSIEIHCKRKSTGHWTEI